MEHSYCQITPETLDTEHLCCAIADKKHQCGVHDKKQWLAARLPEGHVFRKLDAKGKVFIEYAPLESAWVPVIGDNYLYIYCLWVSGKFAKQGHGRALLNSCLQDAKQQGKAGICVLSSKAKRPFLSDRKFFIAQGFQVCDTIGDYQLLALPLEGSLPQFSSSARTQQIPATELTIYYSPQCPYIANCAAQVEAYCKHNDIPLSLVPVDTLEKAKAMPCVFNNWAVFLNGHFLTHHLLNESYLIKLLQQTKA